MTKNDYIVIANIIVSQIQLGHIKKKDINQSIVVASNFLCRDNNRFDSNIFKNYILERI